jgi:transcriptional regulator with XRE-family HTH domain
MDSALAQRLGASLRRLRLAREMTQADVAESAGVSVEFLGRIERGATLPSVPTLFSLTHALGAELGALDDQTEGSATRGASRSEESNEVRRLTIKLRRAKPGVLRLIARLLTEFERASRG